MTKYTNNGGDAGELYIAAMVADKVAEFAGYTPPLFIAGHTHEELPAGCCSIAWEGGDFDYGWTVAFSQSPVGEELREQGLILEPINSVILGVYPTFQFENNPERLLRSLAEGEGGDSFERRKRNAAKLELKVREVREMRG